jgi:hypothetical protein
MTTPAPTLAAAPTAAELADVANPVDRARRITELARTCGTLPGPLASLRRDSLLQALAGTWRVTALAAAVGLSKGRISQITKQGVAAGRQGAPAVAAAHTGRSQS